MKTTYAIMWGWMCSFVHLCTIACTIVHSRMTRCFRTSRVSVVSDNHHEKSPGLDAIPQDSMLHNEGKDDNLQTPEVMVIRDEEDDDHRKSHQSSQILQVDQLDEETNDIKETLSQIGKKCQRTLLKLKNYMQQTEGLDLLNNECSQVSLCSNRVCQGSVMGVAVNGTDPRGKNDILQHAKDFLKQYFTSNGRLNENVFSARWKYVQQEIVTNGTYQLSESELVFGAKLAWRNAARCIGRIQWTELQIFDCRHVTSTAEMFEALCNHIQYCTNNGQIRSAITVFPQRTDGKHDYRVWNPQIIGYAGYMNEGGTILGDPLNVEFTNLCLELGWRGPCSGVRTRFDILPLILSANGDDPGCFDIPKELVLEVPIRHPTYDWFEDLQLKWFGLPTVSSMVFDCGGLEFTAAPFSGWYMSTEIGSRNFCDTHRYNLLEPIADRMGLNTRTPITLWKDKAMIEANIAVLHSFQIAKVTIVDHHTASDSFMRHYEREMKIRKGCPADWVWIVPPISGSATSVFHQEMALYYLKPSYGVQTPAWKTHIWKRRHSRERADEKSSKKFRFAQIAWAVRFALDLSRQVYSRRIKVTVLFASETGTSHMFAERLGALLNRTLHCRVLCMDQYAISEIENETLILIITSTSGNGDSPESGKLFSHNLSAMTPETFHGSVDSRIRSSIPKLFTGGDSETEQQILPKLQNNSNPPLQNVRFAVFALGSSAYSNFCAFGRYVDELFDTLGGDRILPITESDEMRGHEQVFRQWATDLFSVIHEIFRVNNDDAFWENTLAAGYQTLSESSMKLVEADSQPIEIALSKRCNRTVSTCNVLRRTKLTADNPGGLTILLELQNLSPSVVYKPGDHLGILGCNPDELVEGILSRLQPTIDFDMSMELQTLEKRHTADGVQEYWVPAIGVERNSLRTSFRRFFDITTPPAPSLLQYFASIATDINEKTELNLLASDPNAYKAWAQWKYPNLFQVLLEFPSVRPYAPLFIHLLNPLRPRYYSISNSPLVHNNEIHLTIAVVQYKSQGGTGPIHYGVCSNYLNNVSQNELLYVFVRSAPNFHMPANDQAPMILVGPGTGIAPFRGFWQHRYIQMQMDSERKYGEIWLFHGCRHIVDDLYSQEKQQMLDIKVLGKTFLALSRGNGEKKIHVQDLMLVESSQICKMLLHADGHLYVCGNRTMAEDVFQSLKQIISVECRMSNGEVDSFLRFLKAQNRYHEDIYGITSHTTEVNMSQYQSRSRMSSKISELK